MLTSQIVKPTNLLLPPAMATPCAFTTSASLTLFTSFPPSSSHPHSLNRDILHPSPCSQAVVFMAGTNTAPAPGRIFVTHWERITIATLRVAASFWKEFIKYWRIGNFRDEGLGAPGRFGVAVESIFRGNALLINVENESIMMRLVLGGGKTLLGRVSSAMRWARVGVEKCTRFWRESGRVRFNGGLETRSLV
jgi:hypothetical protein